MTVYDWKSLLDNRCSQKRLMFNPVLFAIITPIDSDSCQHFKIIGIFFTQKLSNIKPINESVPTTCGWLSHTVQHVDSWHLIVVGNVNMKLELRWSISVCCLLVFTCHCKLIAVMVFLINPTRSAIFPPSFFVFGVFSMSKWPAICCNHFRKPSSETRIS